MVLFQNSGDVCSGLQSLARSLPCMYLIPQTRMVSPFCHFPLETFAERGSGHIHLINENRKNVFNLFPFLMPDVYLSQVLFAFYNCIC